MLAQSKWAIFYDKISSIQLMLQTQIDDQIVDPICEEEGGAVGDAHFTFVNPNPSNNSEKVAYLKALYELNPMDPVIDNAYIRKELGIKEEPDDDGDEDDGQDPEEDDDVDRTG